VNNEFCKEWMDITQKMFRRYCWSGKRRSELKEICEELGITYLSPKLVHKVRFLSAGGQVCSHTITTSRFLCRHSWT